MGFSKEVWGEREGFMNSTTFGLLKVGDKVKNSITLNTFTIYEVVEEFGERHYKATRQIQSGLRKGMAVEVKVAEPSNWILV
jgi:hypothetical protein